MPRIRIKSGPDKGRVFVIDADIVKLGRDAHCQAQLLDTGVSREHAEIYRVGEMYFIRDLNSRNGIMVNDLSVQDELLREGDVIQLCNFQLVFEGDSAFSDAESVNVAEGTAEDTDESFFSQDKDPGATLTIKVQPNTSTSASGAHSSEFLSVIKQLATLAAECGDIQKACDESLKLLFERFSIDEAFIFIMEGSKLRQKAHKINKDASRGKASRTIVLRTLKEKHSIMTSNVREDFRFKSEESVLLGKASSVLCTPLIALGREFGVIYLNNSDQKKPFTEEFSGLVHLVANYLALIYSGLEYLQRTRELQHSSVRVMANVVESLYPPLAGRSTRVGLYANLLGQQLGLKTRQANLLNNAAMVHHIGYLNMRGVPLDEDKLIAQRGYAAESAAFLKGHGSYQELVPIIANHRGRLDGEGSPGNLKKNEWSIESQILALAVELELRINLPMVFQHTANPIQSIMQELKDEREKFVSAEVIRALVELYENGELTGV
ncbi:MAG: FHA domain-containing protein [Planctomycetes bacterium]|nr:FHA domain-containing protein [Planctomycetota bacterium]